MFEVSLKHDPTGRSKINYLYVPEGNKSHAMYWATEYWIPELVRRGESQDFLYAMMIDDDVPLPPDLHVPNNTLNRYPDIKAVAYVIEAATETGYDNQLVNCQDLEYKMAGFVKQFQYLEARLLVAMAPSHCGGEMFWVARYYGTKHMYFMAKTLHGPLVASNSKKLCYCSQRFRSCSNLCPRAFVNFISTTCNQLGSVCATQIYDFCSRVSGRMGCQ